MCQCRCRVVAVAVAVTAHSAERKSKRGGGIERRRRHSVYALQRHMGVCIGCTCIGVSRGREKEGSEGEGVPPSPSTVVELLRWDDKAKAQEGMLKRSQRLPLAKDTGP